MNPFSLQQRGDERRGAIQPELLTVVVGGHPVADADVHPNLAHQRPWHEMMFGGILGIENQIPEAYTRVVDGFQRN